ncbi:MAG TPA: hypothetical protein DF613_08970 [Lachnospiraceae bacterium]|nr:hypothetical protein [Lachnospiraceae bacterium]
MKLKDWAYLGNYDFFTTKLRLLATNDLAPEKWSYAGKNDFGILKSYLYFTFEKLWQERETAAENSKQTYIYMDENISCFNTGLYDKAWQPIYFYCIKNPIPNYQDWRFTAFYNSYTIKYTDMSNIASSELRRASYFNEPEALIYDIRLDIIPQWEHILYDEENYLRIPEQLRASGKEFCQNLISGAINSVKKRIEANYKTVVPQWYGGNIQLLVPLYLSNPEKPDLALVLSLSDDKTVYYGHTCLTTEMAYNNARLIARPDSYWLQP